MKGHAAFEASLEDIRDAEPGSAAALALVRRIRHERLYKDSSIRTALRQHDDPHFQRVAKEAELLCALENGLLAEIRTISAGFDSPANEFLHTILALETVQRIRLRLPSCPALPLQLESSCLDQEQHQSLYDTMAGWDYFLEYFGIVLKNMLARSGGKSIVWAVTPEHVADATKHFTQATKWQIFWEFCAFWEHGELAVDTEALTLDAERSELVRAFRISLSRVRAFRFSRANDRFRPDAIDPNTRKLPLEAFRSAEEMTSCYLATLQFFSSDLQEIVHGASLAEWIRAYHLLRNFARITLRSVVANEPKHLVVEQEPAFFETLLTKEGGISKRSAESIIQHLTFGPSSNDLLDCPLIPLGERLVMLPSITAVSEPAHSLESMLHSVRSKKTHELNFIGPGLEASIRASLQDGGVSARKITHGNYDCDIAFVLDDVLFLCECKCKFITADFTSYAKWEVALCTDVVKQHKRTCDFFAAHMNLVRQKLKLEATWTPKAIERVIITSAKLGRPLNVDGYWITDHHTVHAYLTRQAATIVVNLTEKFKVDDKRLEGPLTAEGFLDYLGNPQVLAFHQECLEPRSIPLKVGEQSVTFSDCETYGEVQFVGDE